MWISQFSFGLTVLICLQKHLSCCCKCFLACDFIQDQEPAYQEPLEGTEYCDSAVSLIVGLHL